MGGVVRLAREFTPSESCRCTIITVGSGTRRTPLGDRAGPEPSSGDRSSHRPVGRYRDAALFAYLAVGWGASYTAIEVGLEYLPPVLLSALRYDVAALVLLGYVTVRGRGLPRTAGDAAAVAVVGVLSVGGGSTLLFLGQQFTTAGVASVLFSLNPLLATAFARLLLPDDRLALPGIVGLLAGLAGVAAIVRPEPGAVLAGAVGKLLVVASATSVALGAVLVKRTSRSVSSTTITAWGMVVGAAGMHAVSLARGEPVVLSLAPRFLAALAYVSVVAAAGTYAVYFHLLGRVGAIRINLVSYATPPVAVLTGWLLLGERLPPAAAVGFVLVLVGFGLIERRALAAELRASPIPYPDGPSDDPDDPDRT